MLQIIFGCIGMATIILSAIRNYADCVTGGKNEKNQRNPARINTLDSNCRWNYYSRNY